MNHVPIEVGRNRENSAVTFRLFDETFFLDPISARFFAASIVRMAEKVEAQQSQSQGQTRNVTR